MAEALKNAYIVDRSNGKPIQIDADELPKVIKGIERGSVIVVRQGVIIPSYVTGITEDKERVREWLTKCNYGGEEGRQHREAGMRPLEDVIGTGEIAKLLGNGAKQLGSGK